MASTRLIRTTTTTLSCFRFHFHSSSCLGTRSKIRNFGNFGDNREKSLYREYNSSEKKPLISLKTPVATTDRMMISEAKTDNPGIVSIIRKVADFALTFLKMISKRTLELHPQMIIEKAILDCRFFTLFAVAGSLIGSVLCFHEGFSVVLESYFQYFHVLSERSSDLGHVVELLIEAIDMFLIGTAMLVFGMGLHVMFVGSKHLEAKGSQLPTSNFFGLFHLKAFPRWVAMGSVSQAKSKIGHAVMMIMQFGLLEKFKAIPLATALDLACFTGAVFISSISIFLLSRLSIKGFPVSTKFRV